MGAQGEIGDYPQAMTSAQVADLFGWPVVKARTLAREGRPPIGEPGARAWQFALDELIGWFRLEAKVKPDPL